MLHGSRWTRARGTIDHNAGRGPPAAVRASHFATGGIGWMLRLRTVHEIRRYPRSAPARAADRIRGPRQTAGGNSCASSPGTSALSFVPGHSTTYRTWPRPVPQRICQAWTGRVHRGRVPDHDLEGVTWRITADPARRHGTTRATVPATRQRPARSRPRHTSRTATATGSAGRCLYRSTDPRDPVRSP